MRGKNKKMFAFLLLLAMALLAVPFAKSRAAGSPLTITGIDYEAETITVKSTNSDGYLYYSDEKRKKWECAGAFESGSFTMDISWVSKTKDYVLVLKGDKSDEVSVTLPKQDKSFKAKYNFLDEVLTYEGQITGRTISWRKADSIGWETVKTASDGKTLATETLEAFQRLYARGATLYFRLDQVPGDGTNAGIRPSKEVKLSLAKQANAPNLAVKLPGTVAVNDKQEYKVEGAEDWTAVSGKTLEIAEIAKEAYGASAEETKILVRVAATEKKLPSATATVTVLAQEAAPVQKKTETDGGSFKVEFANASTLKISFLEVKSAGEDGKETVTVEKPSSKNPYEYTIVKADETLKDDATWTAITSDTVQISKEKAPQGATVYIRKKARVASALVWQPESLSCAYTVVEYPKSGTLGIATDGDTNALTMNGDVLCIVKQEGAPAKDLKFTITLATGEKFNEETDVKEITCGGKQLTFTSTRSGDVISVTITDTSAYEKAVPKRDEDQDVKITLKNGEVIDKVKLRILHGASVVGSEEANTFPITNGLNPAGQYKIVVKPGLALDKNAEGKYEKPTQVEKLMFMDKEISYSSSFVSDCHEVTFGTADFNEFFLKRDIELDKAYPMTIVMDSGQELTVNVELHETIKADQKQEVRVSVGRELSKDIVITLTCDANVSIGEVKWNGKLIDVEIVGTGNTKTATFKKDAFKGLSLTGANALTAPVVFEVTDGSAKSQANAFLWLTLVPGAEPTPEPTPTSTTTPETTP